MVGIAAPGESARLNTNEMNINSNIKENFAQIDFFMYSFLLVAAQLSCAATASCVHALPPQTPSLLRILWRQTLTSIIFTPLAIMTFLRQRRRRRNNIMINSRSENLNQDVDTTNIDSTDCQAYHHDEIMMITKSAADYEEQSSQPLLMVDKDNVSHQDQQVNDFSGSNTDANTHAHTNAPSIAIISKQQILVLFMAIVGYTLQNDAMVVALQYTNSAAVMCLVNTVPMWLILYSIITFNPPQAITIVGAMISLAGAIICATTGGSRDPSSDGKNQSLGAIIATIGGIGGAMYMTSCSKLRSLGIHPIIFTLVINIGMACSTLVLSTQILEGGINMTSTNVVNGFWGFLSREANPAAILDSIFPDCFGSFGIMLALRYFDPLVVSMVMLTEPLNASLIGMAFVGESAPPKRIVLGVLVVLIGCVTVMFPSSSTPKDVPNEKIMSSSGAVENEMIQMYTSPSLSLSGPSVFVAERDSDEIDESLRELYFILSLFDLRELMHHAPFRNMTSKGDTSSHPILPEAHYQFPSSHNQVPSSFHSNSTYYGTLDHIMIEV